MTTTTLWDAVMDPVRQLPLADLLRLRGAATRSIERDLEAMGDEWSGISGSDVNHTIFAAMKATGGDLEAAIEYLEET